MGKARQERRFSFNEELNRGKEDELLWEFGDESFFREDELKKINELKERLQKIEEDNLEKNKLINNQRKQLDDALKALEEKEKMHHESQILIKTMEANLHQLENERKQFLSKFDEFSKEITSLQDKCALYEEDIRNLTGQLKSRTQENILLNKENKDLQRVNNQLRETIALLEDKVKSMERELSQVEPAREEMEKKYTRALDSLRNEVKAKHQEVLRLTKEVADLKKSQQDLQRINENLELELDMLNTTNVSLQKKIEKLTLQNSILERKLQNRLVRFVLSLCGIFSFNPQRKTKGVNV